MMCTPRDDPMDLGPFLQEYVLRNPFENLPNGVPPGLGAGKQPGPKPITKLSPPDPPAKKPCLRKKLPSKQVSPPVILHTSLPSSGTMSPVLVSAGGGDLSVNETGQEKDGTANVSDSRDNVPQDPDFENENLAEKDIDSALVDTPKAHIGSNLTYAAALRELRLPPKHYKVKKWLTQNYKHVATHPGWLGSDILLKHTKTVFRDMKSSVLSRIMKFTFPECRKVINKYGYFYAGLLPKPDNGDMRNLLLMRASALVDEGHMTMSRAAEQYGCTVNQIGGILAWSKLKRLTEQEVSMIDKEMETKKSSPPTTVSSRLRFQLRLNAQVRQSLASQEKNDTTTQGKNKRKSNCDPSYNPAGVKQKATSCESKGLAVTRNRRKRGRPPKFRESYVNFDHDDIPEDDHVIAKVEEGEREDDKMDDGTVGLMVGEILEEDDSTLKVKEEPVDIEYEKACVASSTCDKTSLLSHVKPNTTLRAKLRNSPSPNTKSAKAKNSTNLSSNCGGVREVAKNVRDCKPGGRASPVPNSTTAGQAINNVVDLLSVRRELSETYSKLTEAQMQNDDLEVKLEDAHKEIAQLRDSLSTREMQITNLANSFFDLSNQFMRASHEFKRVMQSIHPTGVKYDVPPP